MSNPLRSAAGVLFLVDSAALTWAEAAGARALVYATKPAAIVLLLLLVLRAQPLPNPRYRALVLAALGCGLAGDVLLMLPFDLFLPGLVAFLAGHLCYCAAFAGAGGGLDLRAAAGPVLLAGGAVALLWPGLGALRLPVLAYVAVIAAMASLAWSRWLRAPGPAALRAAAGAVLFLASDAALAFGRFRPAPWPRAAGVVFVLATYLAAQWLLASSAGEDRRTAAA